jgi:cytochrome c peroxidase
LRYNYLKVYGIILWRKSCFDQHGSINYSIDLSGGHSGEVSILMYSEEPTNSVRAAAAVVGLTVGVMAFAQADVSVVAQYLPPPVSEVDFPFHSQSKVDLGKLLFYDKILSGNRNISCATCHHPMVWTGDGLALPVGEGGRGLGVIRDTGNDKDAIVERVPRNGPHLFNLGAYEFTVMFHDGRLEEDPTQPGGFSTPAGAQFPEGVESALAAQALFPMTSNTEMAGQVGENSVADAAAEGNLADEGGVWPQLLERLRAIDEYGDLFAAAYPREVDDVSDITISHVANAIGAYEDVTFRAIDSPFDRYMRRDRRAMSKDARTGMRLFYGKAGCGVCHSGPFLTDQQFHAVGMPQIGPGKGDVGPGGDSHGDFGRERMTGDPADRYKFRTPGLRNVALTGPWGHDGAYDTLEAVVRHMMLDPETALEEYDTGQARLPSREDLDQVDFVHHDNPANRAAIAAASEITPVKLRDRQVGHLLDFLNALTDPASLDLRHAVPKRVPSGLDLAE